MNAENLTGQLGLAFDPPSPPARCRCHDEPPPEGRIAKCRLCGRVVGKVRHECHATGCTVEVPERMLMCAPHWRLVPRQLQRAVWAAYVEGQEIRKDPSEAYMEAQRAAVEAVAARERPPVPASPAPPPSPTPIVITWNAPRGDRRTATALDGLVLGGVRDTGAGALSWRAAAADVTETSHATEDEAIKACEAWMREEARAVLKWQDDAGRALVAHALTAGPIAARRALVRPSKLLTGAELDANPWAACGQAAVAALLRRDLAAVKYAFPPHRWCNLTQMRAALDTLGAAWTNGPIEAWPPPRGFTMIEFLGPWSEPGKSINEVLKRTHWIAVDQRVGDRALIFDVNVVGADNNGGWIHDDDWRKEVVPYLVKGIPKASGRWRIRKVLAVPA